MRSSRSRRGVALISVAESLDESAAAFQRGIHLSAQTPRMQDTAEGFGQPIRTVFEPFFRMQRHLPSPFDTKPRYAVKAEDHLWYWIYLPIARLADWLGRLAGHIQRGRISVYLTYSFFTLLALLLFIQ